MSLILYNDDFITQGVVTPPYASISSRTLNQKEYTYGFNATEDYIVEKLENFILFRNSNQTFNISQNVNNKNIGDYTCAVFDTVRGNKFYARIEINTEENSDTRFFNQNGKWENKGRTFTLTLTEVAV